MSQIIDLGKLRFTYTGVYSISTTYELNDVVSYGGNLYHYKFATSTSSVTPTNTTYWNLILSGLKFVGAYSAGTSYKVGELVSQGGKSYLCILDAIAGTAPTNATYWSVFSDGIQYEGEYSEITTYQKSDIVSYGGSAYILTANTSSGNAPTDTAFWTKFVDGAFPNQTGNANKLLTTNGTAAAWTGTPSLTSLTTSADVTVGDDLYVGSGAAAFETSATLTYAAAVVKITGGESSFAQIAFTNAESTSSTDLILYMNNGNDSNGWMGMGIAGSEFDDTTYGITAPGDGYIFHNAIDNTYLGNMVFATGAEGLENKIIFAAGGFASGDTQMEITPGVNVHIEIPTPSTSATTGALTVVGGVGIQGDMNIAGEVNIIGNLTFGGGSTTTANLAVSDPLVFVGNANNADSLDLGLVGEYATTVSPIVATVNNKALITNVATLTTSSAHTYLVGDWVTITGVDATFNGVYQIVTVPTSTTFTYAKTASNVTSAAVSPTGTATVNARRKFSGIVRDASDGIIKTFSDATAKPTTTVNFSEAGLVGADFRAKNIQATGTLAVTSSAGITGDFAVNTDKFTVAASSGNTSVAGTLGVTGVANLNGGATITGTTSVQELRESVVPITLSGGTTAGLDWTAGNVYYIATAPTNAMTFSVTNVPTDTNYMYTINVFVTQGATGRIPTSFTINGGSAEPIRWAGGTTPTGTSSAGKIDVFSFTMQRTASNTWLVYGSSSLNF